jgi:pyruvate/2-oxoglutarate dehydrogenase complex dihydrolipoamide dehydrogenase (E3) component
VWALGDCNGKGAFAHTAYNDYEIVADNLLNNAGRKWTGRIAAYALYTDPPSGRVGMSEAEIRGEWEPERDIYTVASKTSCAGKRATLSTSACVALVPLGSCTT